MLKATEQSLSGVFLLEPELFGDRRGYFLETWVEQKFQDLGLDYHFVQDNESKSSYGVVRGLHYQRPPYTQAKLIRVVVGKILDVVVDLRQNSPTFGHHLAVELDSESKKQLLIPRGFAHGFAVLSGWAIFNYKCDNIYCPASEECLRIDDSFLHIDWRIPPEQRLLSDKDRRGKNFSEVVPL